MKCISVIETIQQTGARSAVQLGLESVRHPQGLVTSHRVVGDTHEGVALDDNSVEEISGEGRHHLEGDTEEKDDHDGD